MRCFRFAVCWIMVLSMDVCSQIALPELPDDILSKTSSEQADLLGKIAAFSYQTLIDVPKKGLHSQRSVLEKMANTRNWLVARGHPLFQLLALRLTEGVERAIANELFRKENGRHGFSVHTPFITGSFDFDLVRNLLRLNEFSRRGYIKYALSLHGDMVQALHRKNYTYEDYADGSVFWKLSLEMQKKLKGMLHGFVLFAGRMSERQAADFVFVQTLRGIDRARDIRVLTKIYLEQGGFPKKAGDLRSLITTELSAAEIKRRFATGYVNTGSDVLHTMNSYAEIRPQSYGQALTFLFYPFIAEPETVIQEKYRYVISTVVNQKSGQWLSLEKR